MDRSVTPVDKHLDAIHCLSDRTGIIGINPVNLIEHHFYFFIRHLTDISNNNPIFKRIYNHFSKMIALRARYDSPNGIGHKIGERLCAAEILLHQPFEILRIRHGQCNRLIPYRFRGFGIGRKSSNANDRQYHAQSQNKAQQLFTRFHLLFILSL